MKQQQLKAQAKEKISDLDARKVYLCIAKHSGADSGSKRMTVRQIARTTRLMQAQIVDCVRECEFLSFVDIEDTTPVRAGDRLVEIQRLSLSAAGGSTVVGWLRKILRKGFTVEFVGYIESAKTPGFLGAYGGVTDHDARQVRIATFDKSEEQIVEALAHEFDHVCGKKKGRSGKHTVCGGQSGVL